MATNREMKKNIERFRAERYQLEQTKDLIKSRSKLNEIYNDSRIVKTLNSGIQLFFKNTEYAITALKQTSLGRGLSTVVKTISIEDDGEVSWTKQVYKAPPVLKKRSDFQISTTAVDLIIYKESKFKETLNAFVVNNGLVQWLTRASRSVVEMLLSPLDRNKYSDLLTELARVEPNFEIEGFIKFCEKDVVPHVLEAMARPDLEVLKDWCTPHGYAKLVYLLDEHRKGTHGTHCRILDVNEVDVINGQFTKEGPVLFLQLETQEMNYSKSADGTITNESVDKGHYVWALLRDLDEPNPKTGWRLADVEVERCPMMV